MLFRRLRLIFMVGCGCAPLILFAAKISYNVDFEGLADEDALKTIKSVSQLTVLKSRPPASMNALRYRAESDVPEILKVLHAHGYYEAVVNVRVLEVYDKGQVIVSIQPGPVYKIQEYKISIFSGDPQNTIVCPQISLENIGIELNQPALAQRILEAELKLLSILSECGYPLASIAKREIIADGETKTIRIKLDVQAGSPYRFGSYEVRGTESVSPELIRRKVAWIEGEEYDSSLVEDTQKSLMDTGLFSSVLITHDAAPQDPEDERLLMQIEIAESKHRSINVGASYQTFYGPGITFGWEHRNISGLGRKLSLQGDITRRSHSGLATFVIPDFQRKGQDYIWRAQALHEDIIPYSERSYSLLNRLERKFGKRIHIAGGIEGELLYVTQSVHNGKFWLLEFPFYFRWSTANSLLNPTKGMTFEYSAIPTANIGDATRYYLFQQISHSYYYPLMKSQFLVLAQKITLGSIASEMLNTVPVSKRFLGGSEEELRGYRYRTVSPLQDHRKPIGGRSAIYYTLETRFRVSKSIGLVPFFDLGSVYLQQLPRSKGKWYKSTGLGIRYFSFMGPFRLDIAFPLDRRKHIDDPLCRFLVNIGQTF